MALNRISKIRIINGLKGFFYKKVSSIVHACNNHLAKDQGKPFTIKHRVIRFIGQLSTLLLSFPNIDTFSISHKLGMVIVVGDAFRANLINKLLSDGLDTGVDNLGRSSVLRLPGLTEGWFSNGAQMVVCSLSPIFPLQFTSPYVITSPSFIRQVLELPDEINCLLEKPEMRRIRRQLNRAQRFGFKSQFCKSKQDFDFYYWKMYIPYIQNRFGDTAVLESYEVQFQEFLRGGLILVMRSGVPISGMLTRILDNNCYYINVGVLESDLHLLDDGLFSYNLWELIKWGHQLGARWVDFGGSFAFQSDGVFQYKSNWGAEIFSSRFAIEELVFLMNEPSSEFIDCMNNKGIIHQHQGKFYQAHFFNNPLDHLDPDLDKQLRIAKRNNLSGLVIVSPFSKRYVA